MSKPIDPQLKQEIMSSVSSGMSQLEAARLYGVSSKTISNWCHQAYACSEQNPELYSLIFSKMSVHLHLSSVRFVVGNNYFNEQVEMFLVVVHFGVEWRLSNSSQHNSRRP